MLYERAGGSLAWWCERAEALIDQQTGPVLQAKMI